jgi:chemotaxis response regulator CheB
VIDDLSNELDRAPNGRANFLGEVAVQDSTIRVVIANGSAVIRRLVTETLLDLKDFKPFPAAHGREVVAQLDAVKPHVVVLGGETSALDSIETIRAIRTRDRNLPIIMLCVSGQAVRNAIHEEIPAGANDYTSFTVLIGHVESAKQALLDSLIPKLRHWTNRYSNAENPRTPRIGIHVPDR